MDRVSRKSRSRQNSFRSQKSKRSVKEDAFNFDEEKMDGKTQEVPD
jgi:hypothetical protein